MNGKVFTTTTEKKEYVEETDIKMMKQVLYIDIDEEK